ncbi:GIY-YIG nuclease family protein [Candidatus Omnitrophota bacterium]
MYYVYILKSTATGKRYIGSCSNVEKRLTDHNANKAHSTRHQGPHRLIHQESFDTKTKALKRERVIKKYKGGRKPKQLLQATPSSSLA